jgi:hypothetical protein
MPVPLPLPPVLTAATCRSLEAATLHHTMLLLRIVLMPLLLLLLGPAGFPVAAPALDVQLAYDLGCCRCRCRGRLQGWEQLQH